MNRFLFALFAVLFVLGCAKPQGDERLKEKSAIEAKGQQDAIDARAREMEARLARQQRFFQGVGGTFVGTLQLDSGKRFDVRFVITPTIPVYEGNRVRSMDEITYDLTNLALNVEERTALSDGFSTGCIYNGLKPKTDGGFILATVPECPVTFVLNLSAGDPAGRPTPSDSAITTQKILDGEIDKVEAFNVEMRSIHKPSGQMFNVRRVEGVR